MDNNGFDTLSPEEQVETLKAYQELTDNKSALDELQADIDARRQGYGEVWHTGFSELDKLSRQDELRFTDRYPDR